MWLNHGVFNPFASDRHSVGCQSVHNDHLNVLVFKNVQVLLTGDAPQSGAPVPLGRHLTRGTAWASWPFGAISLAALWRMERGRNN